MAIPERSLPSLFIVPLTELMVGICVFIALLYGQRELTLLGLLVLGITMGARQWSRLGLSRIRSAVTADKHKLFPGESFVLSVSAENAGFLPVWLQVGVPFEGAFDPDSEAMSFTSESGLLWYQKVRFNRQFVARRRGVYRVGPAWMKVADLLGFFPREKQTAGDMQVIVYPRLVPLKPLSLPSRDFFGVPGAKSPVQDPVYILGTRDYQHGQPARYIHWKASARHHRLQEKLFEPSEQKKILLAVDVSRFEKANASENFERTLEVVGSLAVQFDQRSYALGFVTNGVVQGGSSILPLGRSRLQLPAILEILARLKMRARGSLTDIITRALELPWGVSCIHFANGPDEGVRATAQYLAHRKVPVIFVRCSSGDPVQGNGQMPAGKMYGLDEICIEETQRP
jgi:uncharacterized protein (DUF58 family)